VWLRPSNWRHSRPCNDAYSVIVAAAQPAASLSDRKNFDDQHVVFQAHAEPIHVARGPPVDKRTGRLIARFVLRTLEAPVFREPFQRRVFVRAREIERVQMLLVADRDHLVLAIDRDAVGSGNRVPTFGSGVRRTRAVRNRQRRTFEVGNAKRRETEHRAGALQKRASAVFLVHDTFITC